MSIPTIENIEERCECAAPQIGYFPGELQKLSKPKLIKEIEKVIQNFNALSTASANKLERVNIRHRDDLTEMRGELIGQLKAARSEVSTLEAELRVHNRHLAIEEQKAGIRVH